MQSTQGAAKNAKKRQRQRRRNREECPETRERTTFWDEVKEASRCSKTQLLRIESDNKTSHSSRHRLAFSLLCGFLWHYCLCCLSYPCFYCNHVWTSFRMGHLPARFACTLVKSTCSHICLHTRHSVVQSSLFGVTTQCTDAARTAGRPGRPGSQRVLHDEPCDAVTYRIGAP